VQDNSYGGGGKKGKGGGALNVSIGSQSGAFWPRGRTKKTPTTKKKKKKTTNGRTGRLRIQANVGEGSC